MSTPDNLSTTLAHRASGTDTACGPCVNPAGSPARDNINDLRVIRYAPHANVMELFGKRRWVRVSLPGVR